jgi:lipopolysaccharide transport system ATP-binding protein
MLCGTLTPTSGRVQSFGRIAALLELGAGFNPEFTGRENIYMNAAVLGLTDREIVERIDKIISFADIGLFIDQAVKTYSSGMFVRLAFSIATSVDPDILIVDEALSVGDGSFARKSFDRIMAMRDAGKTILFCSHSLYQVEAICDQVIWLEGGKVMEIGAPSKSIVAYNAMLSRMGNPVSKKVDDQGNFEPIKAPAGVAYIKNVVVTADGTSGKELAVVTKKSCVQIQLEFISGANLKPPSVAVVITDIDGREITSSGTANDGLVLELNTNGEGSALLSYQNFPLLKGVYWVNVLLMCENGIHIYEPAEKVAKLIVQQSDLEVGVVSLPHAWRDGGGL